jgi:hypothetical protein
VFGLRAATPALALAAALTFCWMRPFLPGGYDPLAEPLSHMARAISFAGLLLVPFAAAQVIAARRRTPEPSRDAGTATLIALSVVWLIVTLVGLASSGWSLAIVTLAIGAGAIWKGRQRLRTTRAAVLMLAVPPAAAIAQLALGAIVTEYSRNRAIRNVAPLIADLEEYRASHGRYPPAVPSLWHDYRPAVVGIPQYHYRPFGDSYNLFFEQLTSILGTDEIVMYNPRDEHLALSHDSHALRLAPDQMARGRGYYAVFDGPQPHWKYFRFD